ncbi:hypothetical protein KAJ02_09805 [Candidatus Bipolaricaulota bacterium]|nr:hypothetical protein [Candidatus Bipolaricaulota bacterium]
MTMFTLDVPTRLACGRCRNLLSGESTVRLFLLPTIAGLGALNPCGASRVVSHVDTGVCGVVRSKW